MLAQGCFNPGLRYPQQKSTPKEFANAFSVDCATRSDPGLETQPWAEICERFQRFLVFVQSCVKKEGCSVSLWLFRCRRRVNHKVTETQRLVTPYPKTLSCFQ